eukprot:4526909-Amphidinium_carterae.1
MNMNQAQARTRARSRVICRLMATGHIASLQPCQSWRRPAHVPTTKKLQQDVITDSSQCYSV